MEISRHNPDGDAVKLPLLTELSMARALLHVGLRELRGAHPLNERGQRVLNRLLRIVFWLVVLGAAAIPTWPGEWNSYFLGVIGVSIAWLIGAPQLIASFERLNIQPVADRLDSLRMEVKQRIAEQGHPWESMPEETRSRIRQRWPAATTTGAFRLVRILLHRQAVGLAEALVAAFVGLMVAPTIEPYHIGYWHPVSLLYALPLPFVMSVVFIVGAGLTLRVYLLEAIFLGGASQTAYTDPPSPAEESPAGEQL
ncbi:MAG: hypothetical protein ACRDVP_02175 [Acidimicrobiales bacterium]